MTALSRSKISSADARCTRETDCSDPQQEEPPPENGGASFCPSLTEEEAKARFVSAVTEGMDVLMREHGHGHERASAELLSELADGATPNDDEVFQVMESLGVSLEDAAKVMTVSAAFVTAQAAKGSIVEAIDDLTARLSVAKLTRKEATPQSKPASSAKPSDCRNTTQPETIRNDSGARQSRPSPVTAHVATPKKNLRSIHKGDKQNKLHTSGRKRSLAESGPERCISSEDSTNEIAIEQSPSGPLEVKEIINAKISRDEKKKPSIETVSRSKSPAPPVARAKRSSSLRGEDTQLLQQPVKRPRTSDNICPLV